MVNLFHLLKNPSDWSTVNTKDQVKEAQEAIKELEANWTLIGEKLANCVGELRELNVACSALSNTDPRNRAKALQAVMSRSESYLRNTYEPFIEAIGKIQELEGKKPMKAKPKMKFTLEIYNDPSFSKDTWNKSTKTFNIDFEEDLTIGRKELGSFAEINQILPVVISEYHFSLKIVATEDLKHVLNIETIGKNQTIFQKGKIEEPTEGVVLVRAKEEGGSPIHVGLRLSRIENWNYLCSFIFHARAEE